jgi:acyl-CoA reductase-like NAD-dependent aldehyde dehydrogenase
MCAAIARRSVHEAGGYAYVYAWEVLHALCTEPKGNCLLMAPWNYPIQITLQPLIAAVAAGNVVILKPSEYTPHVNRLPEKDAGRGFS